MWEGSVICLFQGSNCLIHTQNPNKLLFNFSNCCSTTNSALCRELKRVLQNFNVPAGGLSWWACPFNWALLVGPCFYSASSSILSHRAEQRRNRICVLEWLVDDIEENHLWQLHLLVRVRATSPTYWGRGTRANEAAQSRSNTLTCSISQSKRHIIGFGECPWQHQVTSGVFIIFIWWCNRFFFSVARFRRFACSLSCGCMSISVGSHARRLLTGNRALAKCWAD